MIVVVCLVGLAVMHGVIAKETRRNGKMVEKVGRWEGLGTGGCSVVEKGAKGDNRTEDTAAIQAALDDCTTVVFPAPGTYLSRSLFLSMNDQMIVIEEGATLIAWGDVDTWNWTTKVYPLLSVSPNASLPISNIELNGGGVIDGQGWRWWPFLKTRPRPLLVDLIDVSGLFVHDIHLVNSPAFHLNLRGMDILVENVTVYSNPACGGWSTNPNTDAFNIGGENITIRDSFARNGDDCIPTNHYPTRRSGYTRDVLVERVICECGTHGPVGIIGQYGGDGARLDNITYRHIVANQTGEGVGLKISEAYENVTGTWSNILFENITIVNPRNTAIHINVFEEDSPTCTSENPAKPPHWLSAENITYRDITGTNVASYPGCFKCAQERPCRGLVFDNVTIHTGTGEYHCQNAFGTSTSSSPVPCFTQG